MKGKIKTHIGAPTAVIKIKAALIKLYQHSYTWPARLYPTKHRHTNMHNKKAK
jgi:hypothetical protein